MHQITVMENQGLHILLSCHSVMFRVCAAYNLGEQNVL